MKGPLLILMAVLGSIPTTAAIIQNSWFVFLYTDILPYPINGTIKTLRPARKWSYLNILCTNAQIDIKYFIF